MTRKCSHCGNNGHNLRTCPNRGGGGVKIFGVRLDGGGSSFRKCSSMVNLSHHSGGGSVAGDERDKDGYASEGFAAKGPRERKKGVAWTEEEHKMFLLGLRKLGKGDWRGIARNFVVSRTSTQVASHAQKYFIRQMNAHKRKKRTSLFDMMPNELEAQSSNPAAAPLPPLEAEHESTSSNSNNPVPAPSPGEVERAIAKPGTMPLPYVVVPCSPFFPFSYPMWGCYGADVMANSMHSVVKPTAVHSAVPINVGDVPSISKLSLGGEPAGQMSFGSSERISAFHRNNPTNGSGSSSSPIQAA